MNNENYILHIIGTLENSSAKLKKNLLKELKDANLIIEDTQESLFTLPGSVDIGNVDLNELDAENMRLNVILSKCFNESKEAVKIFEKWEFVKDYKYSAFFLAENFPTFLSECRAHTVILKQDILENTYLEDQLSKATQFEDEEYLIVKFSLCFSAYNIKEDRDNLLKYPVLIVCHKNLDMVELRFDTLKQKFFSEKKASTIYRDIITSVLHWCKEEVSTDLLAENLDFMIQSSKNGKDNIKLMSQYTKQASGGNAQLDVGKNEDYIMPIIGDLKEILKKPSHIIELEKTPLLKVALEQLLFEHEEMADYSWIEVMWENELKSKNNRVKLTFNYKNNDYCLLQHYFSNSLIGMERMNDVAKYINEHRSDASSSANST